MNRTSLYDLHVDAGARLVDFAGWEMPVQYTSIIEEHLATRNSCTIFDVSHMGRLFLTGKDAETLLEYLCTRAIGSMKPGQCRYSHICKEDGGILDDVIVSRFENKWLVVCNASNRDKIVSWIGKHAQGKDVSLNDQTIPTTMVAIQGPLIQEVAEELLPVDVSDIKRYHFKAGRYLGIEYVCSRTGYTGEDGYEIIVSRAAGKMLASGIYGEKTSRARVIPAGLGARNTLRLEAAMPLYGHELSENIDSITAGQKWCIKLDKDFIGAEYMRQVQQEGPRQKLVGLEIEGKRIARQDTPLEKDGQQIGIVTSGTLSPTLQKVIALGYVQPEFAEEGTEMDANSRGRIAQARVVPLPFFKRPDK